MTKCCETPAESVSDWPWEGSPAGHQGNRRHHNAFFYPLLHNRGKHEQLVEIFQAAAADRDGDKLYSPDEFYGVTYHCTVLQMCLCNPLIQLNAGPQTVIGLCEPDIIQLFQNLANRCVGYLIGSGQLLYGRQQLLIGIGFAGDAANNIPEDKCVNVIMRMLWLPEKGAASGIQWLPQSCICAACSRIRCMV